MKVSEYQNKILAETGLKTSVKKNTGSMKHHLTFTPMFQGGDRPRFDFEWATKQRELFKSNGIGIFCTIGQLDIPCFNFSEFDPIIYKRESKPKPVDADKPTKGWGSKNSQMRLDKASRR